jgi:Fe-S-cluster containining protein
MAIIRVGACLNCGECCKRLDGLLNLPQRCIAYLPEAVNGSHCAIYKHRPLACRVSPRSPRDIVCSCGFQFVDAQSGKVVDKYMMQDTEQHLRIAQKQRAGYH